MPRRCRSRADSVEISSPINLIEPAAGSRSPVSASTSSVCPLPCTPAIPTTSPALTVEIDAVDGRFFPFIENGRVRALRGAARRAWPAVRSTVKLTGRPTIISASPLRVAVFGIAFADDPAGAKHADPVGDLAAPRAACG